MRRPGTQLTPETLIEESRFILRTLQREDLFGERVRLTEAERVIDSSISLSFADYCGFLNKYGYVRIDQLANTIEVTEGGGMVARDQDDAEFHARITRHFSKELGSGASATQTATALLTTRPVQRSELPTAMSTQVPVARPARPSLVPQTDRPASMLDDVLDRRYRRGNEIGSGTVGTVYRAEHVTLMRPLALKEARGIFQFASYLRREEIIRRLRSAIEIHASLLHPNIIQVIDQNTEREYPYFVMEHASGGNLRQRMEREKENRLELTFAVRVLLQICYALKHAHAQDVLHLGLKPENVLFDNLGNVKITDFGFSRITERAEDSTQTPVLVGGNTVGYMAPERLQPTGTDSKKGTAAADIYSLGMLFYEMITGKLPGRRSPLPSQARKDVPAAFDDVFDKMTRDELSERYTRVDEVLDGLYKAFPSKEVFGPGSILLWAADPKPMPADAGVEVSTPSEAPDNGKPTNGADGDDGEGDTGELELARAKDGGKNTLAPGRRKGPPPPPRK